MKFANILKKIKIKYVINAVSILIFVISYFYISSLYTEKANAINQEIDLTKKRIKEAKEELAKEEKARKDTLVLNELSEEIMDRYPAYISKEDNLIFVDRMEELLKIRFSSINISDLSLFYDTTLPARTNASKIRENLNSTPTITGMQSSISLSFQASYDGWKELVEYVRNYPEWSIIERASVSFDGSSGLLTGTMVIKRFSLTGTGKDYSLPKIDKIRIGRDNIFGTIPVLE